MTIAPCKPLFLTKFDVAERQLNQAIALFFDRGDPVSIHTLAEATAQVLYDLKEKYGVTSIFRDNDRIRDEYKNVWFATLFKSRNFFKHADRDGDVVHEFKEEFNHFSLSDAVNMYLSAKKAWTPETLLFLVWFAAMYPNIVKEGTDFSALVECFRSGPDAIPINDLSFFSQVLSSLRSGKQAIPGVVLELGLPE